MAANTRLAVAAHVVAFLASRDEDRVSSLVIAASVNTHPVVIRRTLAALARRGIVESEKGKGGGSRLARSPARVTLWDLCVALEEEHLFAVHRNAENPLCPVSCRMKRALAAVFADVERAARRRLAAVTIAELLEDCAP